MSRLVLPSYTVIRDTREKDGFGWNFLKQPETKKPPRCNGTIIQTLETADYSLIGYEDILAIERKDDFSELWTNYSNRITFENEMERLSKIKYKFILIETGLSKDHFDLSPCQFTRSVPGVSMLSWLVKLSLEYDVHFMPVGECGAKYSTMIFKEIIRKEKDRWIPQDENV